MFSDFFEKKRKVTKASPNNAPEKSPTPPNLLLHKYTKKSANSKSISPPKTIADPPPPAKPQPQDDDHTFSNALNQNLPPTKNTNLYTEKFLSATNEKHSTHLPQNTHVKSSQKNQNTSASPNPNFMKSKNLNGNTISNNSNTNSRMNSNPKNCDITNSSRNNSNYFKKLTKQPANYLDKGLLAAVAKKIHKMTPSGS
jgi:hypothetical protein